MSRQELEREVISHLRDTALAGSDRPIDLNSPLGEIGLGLDSLALLTFFSSLEKRIGIEFLDAHWMGRSDLTLSDLVDVIVIAKTTPPATMLRTRDIVPRPRTIHEVLQRMGIPRGLIWLAGRAVARIARMVFERDAYVILSLPLGEKALPYDLAARDIEVREGSPAEAGALRDLYPQSRLRVAIRDFEARARAGYLCLLAWHGKQLVGIDWIAASEHSDSVTGIVYEMTPGTCCGVDLYEHRDWGGRGIGLTLLLASLRESEARGFRRQVSVVTEVNLPMLAASVQLIGFKRAGSIWTKRIFGRPFSTWQVGTQRGRGGKVVL